ncbi:MAG: hypothetical protein ACLGH0_13615, partial [Thermoanaerobaculia bacterium]
AAARGRVAEALAKGDTAGAQKLLAATPIGAAGGITYWESIRSCGFYPQETRLECVVDIHQPNGYGGPVGSFGTFEYVSFYVDWQNNGFQPSDYVGSGIVHITDGSAKTQFAVYRDFNPPGGPRTSNTGATANTTTNGPIYNVLARLSWAQPVFVGCGNQVYGNDYQFRIRLMPVR